MKKLIILIAVSTLAFVGVLTLAQPTQATTFNTAADAVVEESEVIDGSYYSAGDKLTINGIIEGDVYCAGGTINITGTVKGDVMCAGQNISIEGVVEGDVRVAAQSAIINGEVQGSLTAMAVTVSTGEDFKLAGDATILAATIDAHGAFGRDVVASGATMNLRGTVARNLTLQTENLTLAKNSQVVGNLDYTHQAELTIDETKIGGEVVRHQPDRSTQSQVTIQTVIGSIMMLVAMIIIYPLLLPNLTRKINAYGRQDMVYTVLVGVAALVLVPIVSLMSLLTIVGIPFAIVLMMFLAVSVIVGLAQGAALLGECMLSKSTNNTLLQTLGGGLVLAIAVQIPILGLLVAMTWVFVGTGLVARYTAKHLLERPVYKSK